MTPSEFALPKNTLPFLFLPPSHSPGSLLCFYVPLSLSSSSLMLSSPLPSVGLLACPASSALQLVVLKEWSAGRLVGEGSRRRVGACSLPQNMRCFSDACTKGLLPNKQNTVSHLAACQTHCPNPKDRETWEQLSVLWMLIIG